MLDKIFCVFFCVLLCFLTVFCQLEEGSTCFHKVDAVNGTCVSLNRCLSIVYDIKLKKYPQLCSFKGREPIICCTDCELVNDTSNVLVDLYGSHYFKTGVKSVDKCLEYVSSYQYPCPVITGLRRNFIRADSCYMYAPHLVFASVGGKNANVGEFPHMALLGYGEDLKNAQWLCGGSVISDRFILTAAHCLSSNSIGPVRFVALGILKRTDSADKWQTYFVKRAVPYPQYKPPLKYHDIALLEVEPKITFSQLVLPACLNAGSNVYKGQAKATGWGALGHRKSLAETLQVVILQQFSDEECAAAYPPHRHLPNGYDQNTQTCYGDQNKVIDTCEGDSGGPLQVSSGLGSCVYEIIGVTSYGRPCGFLGSAGMYTRVENYVPWIESVVWPS